MNPRKFSVLQLSVHLLEDYTSWLMEQLEQKIGTHVVTLNAEMVMLTEQNQELAQTIREAELVMPDGAGIIFYLLLRGIKQRRCPGIELAASMLEKAGQLGESCPICFYGGKPAVIEAATKEWQKRVPGITITANHGYLSSLEVEEWKKTLQNKQPRLILVGLGVPRQESWIRQNRHLCPEAIWIGVGGSFDIWSGLKSRAPLWLRENNLEWLYRLYQEPWRWQRMLVLPQFFWRALFTRNKAIN